MKKRYNWRPSTLNKAGAIIDTIPPATWLSVGGKQLLRLIDVLGAERPVVNDIFALIQQVAQVKKWNMPLMADRTEKHFLNWVIRTRLSEKGLLDG